MHCAYRARHRARRPVALLAAATLTLTGAAVLALSAPTGAVAATRVGVVAAAGDYGPSRGYHVALSILDTRTGRLYHSGEHTARFASESVVKVMIAARLIHQGRLRGRTKSRAWKMITQSDDGIASSFYGSVGGDSLITWVKHYYRVPDLGTPPIRRGWWGNTHITSDGLVQLYAKLRANPRVSGWLLHAMHHARAHGSDGFYQWFGLHQADPHAAIKQGWGTDDNSFADADENTTGFVDDDRYAVAILGRGPIDSYGRRIGAMLSHSAKVLLPSGQFPDAAPHLSRLSAHSGRSGGGTPVTLDGSSLTGTTGVLFGTHHASSVRVLSSGRVLVVAPAHQPGVVRLVVESSHGHSTSAGPRFTFVDPPTVTAVAPAQLDTAGGTQLTVTGTDLARVKRVVIGGTPAQLVGDPSDTELTVVAPAHDAARMHVRVHTAYGLSRIGPANAVTYAAPSPR